MGLDITSKVSKKTYCFSYSGLHQLRWVAYKLCEGEKDFGSFVSMQDGIFGEDNIEYGIKEHFNHLKLKESHYDWAYIVALQNFPNLMWHSDCEGTYTLDDEVESLDSKKGLLKGNLRKLFIELTTLSNCSEKIKKQIRWGGIFPQLYELVKDVLKKKGILEFH